MDTATVVATAIPAAVNTIGIPTLILVPLVCVIAIAAVVGVMWIYKKLNKNK